MESHALTATETFDLAVDLTTISQRLLTYAKIFVYDFDAHDKSMPIAAALDCYANTLKVFERFDILHNETHYRRCAT